MKKASDNAVAALQPVLALMDQGQWTAAATACSKLLKRFPKSSPVWLVDGLLQRRLGQPDAAVASYRKAIALDGRNLDAHNNLGNVLRDTGRLDEAVTAFQAAAALRPDWEVPRLALAEIQRQRGELAQAAEHYAEVVRLAPANLSGWLGQAAVARLRGEHGRCEQLLQQAQAQWPQRHEVAYELASLRDAQGDVQGVLQALDQVLALRPGEARAHFLRAQRLERLGDIAAAEAAYQATIASDARFWDAYNALGQLYVRTRRFNDGLASFERGYQAGGRIPLLLKNLGIALLETPDASRAIAVMREYLALVPDDINIRSAVINAEMKLCRWDGIGDVRAQVIEPALNWSGNDWPPLPFSLMVLPVEISEAETQRIAQRYSEFVKARTQPDRFKGQGASWAPGQRLRLGYLSVDFNNHAVAQLMLGVFKRHDRSRFELFAYSIGPNDGSIYRQRIEQEVDHFIDLRPMDDLAAAARIHADGIHLLIDLTGYTRGNRAAIMAQRPAPVQLQYLGYPGTMGTDFIDYMLTDRVIAPPESQPHYSEQLLYMPNCYQANDDEQSIGIAPTRAECGLPEDAFVFCCFCNLYKIEPVIFALWMRVLKRVPNSVIWFSAGAEPREHLKRYAAEHGVDPARLYFASRIEDKKDHLARHACADLFLDTYFYNAHTTASDALWAGLPVLTCPGPGFSSRVGAALMHGLAMPELVAADLDEYERLAEYYATHPEATAALRQTLAHQRVHAPVFQTDRFVRDMDEQLWAVAHKHLRGGEPLPVSAPPSPEISADRALALYREGDNQAALAMVQQLLRETPARADLMNFAAVLQRALGQPALAEAAYREAIRLAPGFVDPYSNLGNVLVDLGRLEEAEAVYRQAVALAPSSAGAHASLGKTLRDLERFDEADACFRQALALAPDDADTQWDYALAQLAMGRYREGFAGYEWRWIRKQPAPPSFAQPAWDGSPLTQQTLLIYAEQGIGDVAQYLRFLPRVLARASDVVLEVPEALLPLVPARPGLRVVARGGVIPMFDRHYALMSLPYLFGLDAGDIGMDAPYLQVPPTALAQWRERLGEWVRPRIGVVWAGNPNHKNDHARSIRLAGIASLFKRSEVAFYLLQVGPGRADLEGVTLPAHVTDLGESIHDFADTGAIMSLMDVIISPDTSTVHVAGALGLSVWTLIAKPTDWRWLADRRDTPWYPSMRLFRQSPRGDWVGVLREVDAALDTLLAQTHGPAPVVSDSVPSWAERAVAAHRRGEVALAEAAYREALREQPGHAELWRNLGSLLRGVGRQEEALACYRQSLAADPAAVATLILMSDLLRVAGDAEAAMAAAQRATELDPSQVAGWNNLGAALVVAGRREQALAAFQSGLARDAVDVACLTNACWQLLALGRYQDCVELAAQGRAALPDNKPLLQVQVLAWRRQGMPAQAMAALGEWLARDPQDTELAQAMAEAGNEYGVVSFNQGELDAALVGMAEAARWAPEWPVAHYNLALMQLHHLDYRHGWAEFEWRRKLPQIGPHLYDRPLWQGEPLDGRTLLVHWEQGFGDSIQFLRFVPLLVARGARVVLEIQAPLKPLCEQIPGLAGVFTIGEVYPPGIELKCSLLSLPHLLGIEPDTLPVTVPYLRPPAERIPVWQARLGAKRRPRIGLVWAGSPTNATEHARAPGLEAIRQLWQCTEVEFVIIQKGAGRAALAELSLPDHVIDVGESLNDFADTAAVMMQLDAMISSDTSTAHLAGSLGIPLWVPLHFTADWRWVTPNGHCLWYPSAQLFRQSEPGRWDDVIDALTAHLAHWLTEQKEPA